MSSAETKPYPFTWQKVSEEENEGKLNSKAHCSKSSFFVQKFNFDFPRNLSIFLGGKTRENVVVLDFLAVDTFNFTRKFVKKILGEKLVKMLGVVKIEFLDNF